MKIILIFTFFVHLVAANASADTCANHVLALDPEIQEILGQTELLKSQYESIAQGKWGWLSKEDRIRQLKVMNEFFKVSEITHDLTEDKRSEVLAIARRVMIAPHVDLTVSEARLIASSEWGRAVFKTAIYTSLFAKANFWLTRKVFSYWQGQTHVLTFFKEKGWWTKTKRFVKSVYNGPFRLLTSFALPRWEGPIDSIFRKLYSTDGNYVPSTTELHQLQEMDALDTFTHKQDFIKSHLTWNKLRRWVGNVAVSVFILAQVSVANFALHTMQSEPLSTTQFLSAPEHQLEKNQIRLYNETVPFPHMAIEIDGKVYSYGQTHITSRTTTEYLRLNEIAAMFAADNNRTPEGLWNWSSAQGGKLFSSVTKRLGPRAVQIVEINLTQEGHDRMSRFFESSIGKKYRNSTFVMDCATMLKYALDDSAGVYVPPMVDASPGLMNNYLAMLKTLRFKTADGRTLIGDILQVTADEEKAASGGITLRNLAIVNLEANVFAQILPLTIPQRVYKEVVHGRQAAQYWQPGVYDAMEEIGIDVLDDIESGSLKVQVDTFKNGVELLLSLPEGEDKARRAERFTRQINYFFDSEIAKAQGLIDAPNTNFSRLLSAAYEKHHLQILENNLLARLEGRELTAEYRDHREVLEDLLSEIEHLPANESRSNLN